MATNTTLAPTELVINPLPTSGAFRAAVRGLALLPLAVATVVATGTSLVLSFFSFQFANEAQKPGLVIILTAFFFPLSPLFKK